MVQIIAGEKGKGKTKILIQHANSGVKTANGSIVYLDKNNKHMYELSNKLRLINVHDYYIKNSSEFIGFILGLISQDNDLEKVYLDSFLTIACTDEDECENVLNQLDDLSNRFHVDFVVSISLNDSLLTEERRKNVLVAL